MRNICCPGDGLISRTGYSTEAGEHQAHEGLPGPGGKIHCQIQGRGFDGGTPAPRAPPNASQGEG